MIVFNNTGSLLHQRIGAEYSSLSSAAGCESLAEKTIGFVSGRLLRQAVILQ